METNVSKLESIDPQLVGKFNSISHEELIEAACEEAVTVYSLIDTISLFNEECTISMSKPDYKIEDIRKEIQERKALDIDEYCSYFIEDNISDEDILKAVKERGLKYLNS